MRLIAGLALLALAGLSACGSPRDERTATNASANGADEATNALANVANVANPTNAVAPVPVADQTAGFDRLGPIRIGATIAELKREGLRLASRDDPMEGSSCGYAHFKGLPEVAAMLDGDRVVRVDIGDQQHETPGGVRVGMSEAEALKRLGGKAKVEPHPYTGPKGHYLVVHDDGAPRGLIVETDGKQVGSYRFGLWEQVQWVEGCS